MLGHSFSQQQNNLQIPLKPIFNNNKKNPPTSQEFPFTKFFKFTSHWRRNAPAKVAPPRRSLFSPLPTALHLAPSCPLIHKHKRSCFASGNTHMHKHCLPCARAKRATNSSCESERERAKHSTKRALQSRCFFFFVLLPLAALLRHETYFLFLCKRFVFY